MKEIFYIEDSPENKISYYLLLLFLICLPFDRFYSELLLIVFGIHTLIHIKRISIGFLYNKNRWIVQSVFLLSLLGLCYSSFKKEGWELCTKQSAIFIFPLLFGFTKLDLAKYKQTFFLFFSVTCTVAIVYLYITAFHIILYNHFPLGMLFSYSFINHNFSMPIGIHATYLSMYVFIAFTYFLYQFIIDRKGLKGFLYITCMIILLSGLIQLGSKTVLFTLLIAANVVILFFIQGEKKRGLFLVLSILISVMVLGIIFTFPVLKNKYITGFRDDLVQYKQDGRLSESRRTRWQVAIGLIKQSPLMGHGTGSELPLLKEAYFNRKLYVSYLTILNTHNQYLSIAMSTGMIGLLLFLYTFYVGFKVAIKKRDILFVCFLLIITTVSFTENALSVNKGVFFYSFFFSLQLMSLEKT